MTALVIGKFMPFHNGHEYLIQRAAEATGSVRVVVYDNGKWPVTGSARAAMIREQMQGAPVVVTVIHTPLYDDYDDPNMWRAHNVALLEHLGHAAAEVSHVFGSEVYVEKLAAHLGEHVGHEVNARIVDLDRTAYPVSGTMVRGDYAGNWHSLPLATRRAIMPRVVVVGAESTGTTTLSQDLATAFKARWVPEFGRGYTEDMAFALGSMSAIRWTDTDFAVIAGMQDRLEENSVASLNHSLAPLLIADTDSMATEVWRRRYMEARFSGGPATHPPSFRRDLYLITDYAGVPFEDDGLRDGEHLRADMQGEFIKVIGRLGVPWALISGAPEERLRVASRLIQPLLLNP